MSITAARRSGENAFSCTTSGQAGKYGSRPFASTRSPTLTNEAGSCSRSSSLPQTKYSGWADVHAWSGATWFGTKSRISFRPRRSSSRRAEGEALRAAELCRNLVVADAVRRTDHVRGGEIRQRVTEALHERMVLQRDLDPGRAALPDAHQPDRVETERRDRVPLLCRHAGEIDVPVAPAPQLVEPHPCVDLVDERMLDERRPPLSIRRLSGSNRQRVPRGWSATSRRS